MAKVLLMSLARSNPKYARSDGREGGSWGPGTLKEMLEVLSEWWLAPGFEGDVVICTVGCGWAGSVAVVTRRYHQRRARRCRERPSRWKECGEQQKQLKGWKFKLRTQKFRLNVFKKKNKKNLADCSRKW